MSSILITQVAAQDAPIACTLPATQYRSRTADLTALAERTLRSREQTDHGERLTFDAGEQVERELRAAVTTEAACCAFITWQLARTGDALVLDIGGPADARPIIAELFA